jgi:hypothetical protein
MGSPTEGALLVVGLKFGLGAVAKEITRVDERPFSSETKWMAVQCQGRGIDKLWFIKVHALFNRLALAQHIQPCAIPGSVQRSAASMQARVHRQQHNPPLDIPGHCNYRGCKYMLLDLLKHGWQVKELYVSVHMTSSVWYAASGTVRSRGLQGLDAGTRA